MNKPLEKENSLYKLDGKWFFESSKTSFPGQAMALEVDEILFHEKSEYQDVLVFQRYFQCHNLINQIRINSALFLLFYNIIASIYVCMDFGQVKVALSDFFFIPRFPVLSIIE